MIMSHLVYYAGEGKSPIKGSIAAGDHPQRKECQPVSAIYLVKLEFKVLALLYVLEVTGR
jgi:hypothetical protein